MESVRKGMRNSYKIEVNIREKGHLDLSGLHLLDSTL
jgi:hypothetical protein